MTDRQPKPCPSCEETDWYMVTGNNLMGIYAYFIDCNGCGLQGPVSPTRDGAFDLWDALPRREEWRSVTDDPPEDGLWVWGHRPNGSITEAYPVVWFDEGETVYNKEPEDRFDLPITHWMPIPPPPRVPSLGLNEVPRKE